MKTGFKQKLTSVALRVLGGVGGLALGVAAAAPLAATSVLAVAFIPLVTTAFGYVAGLAAAEKMKNPETTSDKLSAFRTTSADLAKSFVSRKAGASFIAASWKFEKNATGAQKPACKWAQKRQNQQ